MMQDVSVLSIDQGDAHRSAPGYWGAGECGGAPATRSGQAGADSAGAGLSGVPQQRSDPAGWPAPTGELVGQQTYGGGGRARGDVDQGARTGPSTPMACSASRSSELCANNGPNQELPATRSGGGSSISTRTRAQACRAVAGPSAARSPWPNSRSNRASTSVVSRASSRPTSGAVLASAVQRVA